MSKVPTVSVVMPTYNAGRFLSEAVRSVLAQTFTDLELLVIDDGSTDDTPAVMAAFTDPRIRYVRHERNRGLVAVLNEGLDRAQGRYIARMDADDRMRNDRLLLQVTFLEAHPEITLVASYVDLIDTDGERTGVWDTDRATATEASIRAMMPRTNCIAHSTVMIRRSHLGTLRYAGRHEDWDLWLRLLSRGKRLAKIPEALVELRVHASSYMGGLKHAVPLERRLMRSRAFFLRREWSRGRFRALHGAVLYAQLRTWMRYLRNNVVTPLLRDAYRLFTYSPVRLFQERRALNEALARWQGRHAFVFSYLNTGGAEQVHADIMATVADQHPLIVITGFSKDRAFAERFADLGILVEVPRLLHHPFTRKTAQDRIVRAIDAKRDPVLFGANTDHFFAWLPFLREGVRAIHLMHAFLHQPAGNVKYRSWLPLFGRVERFVFVSRQALEQFALFLQANQVPRSTWADELTFIPNGVHAFGAVQTHDRMGVLFVGRDSAEKRLDLFLKVAERVHALHPGRCRFTVVGADRASEASFVTFKGTVNDPNALIAIYADHDVLVLTSEREGFPMVIMEAMAQGLTVLATPVGDIPGRLDPTVAVVTSSVRSDAVIAEMTSALVQLLDDPVRLSAMRKAALEHAHASYAMRTFRERYRALLTMPALEA
jgi:glycosyltransferase involved in cell wall biosynthesis